MASLESWLNTNWFNIVQTISIVLGLVFAGLSLQREARSRRLSNLLALKEEHRELWKSLHENPALLRILAEDADLVASPMSTAEEVFLRQLISHVAVSFELVKDGMPLDLRGLKRDVGETFSRPLPGAAWQRAKDAQSRPFMRFVQEAVKAELKRRKSVS